MRVNIGKAEIKDVEIDQIAIEPGGMLTVWLSSPTPDGFPRSQVEIRVLPDGTRQIFTNGDIQFPGFSVWHSMQESYHQTK